LPYEKTQIVEVSSEALGISGSTIPTEDQLTEYIQSYVEINRPGVSKYSMTIDYKDDAEITKINLGDVAGVLLPEYAIRLTARCNKVVFDCLAERNESIELGDVDAGLAGEIAALSD
jgi:phage-related protein